jgi:hypothetical protein
MLESGDEGRWCFLWCSRYREPLSRSWPREGDNARSGETEDRRRLLSRPRSSASDSVTTAESSCAAVLQVGIAAAGASESVDADMSTVMCTMGYISALIQL